MIEVSGVRSSCDSVEVNSFFMRSASSCAVMSRPCAITDSSWPSALTRGVTVHSHTTSMPSRRGLRTFTPASGARFFMSWLQSRSKSGWYFGFTRRRTDWPASSSAA